MFFFLLLLFDEEEHAILLESYANFGDVLKNIGGKFIPPGPHVAVCYPERL